MKARKVLVWTMLFSAFLLFSTAASAGWYQCTVEETGLSPSSGSTFVRLVHVQTYSGEEWSGSQLFRVPAGSASNAVYATALTAISSGLSVKVRLDTPTVANSDIAAIYIMKQ